MSPLSNQRPLFFLCALHRSMTRFTTRPFIGTNFVRTFGIAEPGTSSIKPLQSLCPLLYRKFHHSGYVWAQNEPLLSKVSESRSLLHNYEDDSECDADDEAQQYMNGNEKIAAVIRKLHGASDVDTKLLMQQCEELRRECLESLRVERVVDALILRRLLELRWYNAGFSYAKFLFAKDLFNPASAALASQSIYQLKELDKADQAFILKFYEAIIVDKLAATLRYSPLPRFYCLVRTDRWKEAIEQVQNMPLPSNSLLPSLIFIAYLNHGLFDASFEYLAKLAADPKNLYLSLTSNVHETLLQALIDQSKKSGRIASEQFAEYVERMGKFSNVNLPSNLEPLVKTLFQNIGENFRVDRTSVGRRSRKCANCSAVLQAQNFTVEQYEFMKEAVLSEVLMGDDVFRSSSPLEVKKFRRFIEANAPFDLVFDGLNIVLGGAGRRLGKVARIKVAVDTITSFKRLTNAKKVCVILREHLCREDPFSMKRLEDEAMIFKLTDRSHEDPFILYTALAGASRSFVVTKDDFDFLKRLTDPTARLLLQHWNRVRVISEWETSFSGELRIKLPPNFAKCFQLDDNTFHIPLSEHGKNFEEKTKNSAPPKDWICISKRG